MSLESTQIVLLFLLVLVALFAAVAQRLRVPYPIVLVLAGLAISFIPHAPRIQLNPDLVFQVFLPPLLFASAWQTDWRDFRANLVPIGLLAVGLVAFTVWGVAEFADRFITALDFKSGFLLGAVVATTDAIAATSIAKTIGLPGRIVDLLEGESLLNDATGLLALEFGRQLLLQGTVPSVGAGVGRLLWLSAGGIAIGLLLGACFAFLERFLDDGPIEVVVSLVVPYMAYLAAEQVQASGVLAVVACALFLSHRSATFYSPATRIQVTGSWQALNFVLNGLIFILIGLQLPYVLDGIRGYSHLILIGYSAAFCAVLIALRLAWVYPATGLAYLVQTRLLGQPVQPYSARGVFVVGWTGMRGVIALAAAISLPETLGDGRPFEQRNLILFVTFAIILVTLVVQGLTLPALIRLLGLARPVTAGIRDDEREARAAVIGEAVSYLETRQAELAATPGEGESSGGGSHAHSDGSERHIVADLLHRYRHRLDALAPPRRRHRDCAQEGEGDPSDMLAIRSRTVGRVLEIERATLLNLRDQGSIGDEMLRRLERELDLTETRESASSRM